MMHVEKPKDFSPKFNIVSCFVERNKKILLLLRQDSKPQGNTWGVPAGKAEQNEPIDKAIQRELDEETGILVPSNILSLAHSVYVRYPDFDFIYHIYHLQLDHDCPVRIDSDAHKNFIWVSPHVALQMNLIQDEDACIRLFYKL